MSAFVVPEEIMFNVICGIKYLRRTGYKYPNLPEDEEELITTLYKLNYSAVNQRYREHNRYIFEPFPTFHAPTPIQMFKSVGCLVYQCSEGNVPKRKEYRELEKIEGQLAINIASKLPEYNKAKWA